MKKIYKKTFFYSGTLTILSCIVFMQGAVGQTVKKNNGGQEKGYTTKWTQNPFDHHIFIENRGQFNKDIPNGNDVLFMANLGDIEAYFTTKGLVYRWNELVKGPRTEKNDPDAFETIKKTHYLTMQWEKSNPGLSVDAENKKTDYYVYSTGPASSINVNIYKKLVYHNLYPGIDAEFVFPDGKEGIKYSLIVHPGADISKVKINYSGSKGMQLDGEGNVIIQSEMDNFTEHAPVCFYSEDNTPVSTGFKVSGSEESFYAKDLDKTKTLVIDPWVTDPLFTSPNFDKAYDLDFDYGGNVYAYGGKATNVLQLVKMNSGGIIQWTYNASSISGSCYGDVATDRVTRECYLVQGFPGGQVLKISTLGALLGTYPGDPSTLQELWRAEYDACNRDIVIAGGGTSGKCQAGVLDTTMVTLNPVDVLGVAGALHDMALMAIDPSGNTCYMASAQSQGSPTVANNMIVQLPLPTLSPTTYQVHEFMGFTEVLSVSYTGFGGGNYATNAMNGAAASPSWLYLYNGDTLRRYHKNTGIFSNQYGIRTSRPIKYGGLDVDPCDKLFIGVADSIYVIDSTYTVITKIPLTDTVFDVRLGLGTALYACGKGYVTQIVNPSPSKLISTVAGTPTSCSACDGKATVNVNCGIAPFKFVWNDGSTNETDTGLCAGLYTVTVTDGSCPPRVDSAIVSISGKSGYTATLTDTNPDCGIKKGNITVFPTGGTAPYTFTWSNGETNQKDTGLVAGTYSCTVTDNGGCKFTVFTTLINPTVPIITISPNPDSVCIGSSTKLTASGAKTYLWNPGALIGTSVTVSPVVNTTYTVNGIDSNGCTGSATITVVVNPLPTVSVIPPSDSLCAGSGITITASGASTYSWSPAAGLSCLTCPNPLASPSVNTTYTVVGKNSHGCIDSNTVKIVVKPKPIPTITIKPSNDTICNGDSAMLVAGGGGIYDWTFSGSPKDTIWVKPATSTIYTLQVTLDGCIAIVSKVVTVVGSGVPKITVSKDSICTGDSTKLTATGGGTYKWLVPGNPTGSFIWVKPLANATYSVVVSTPCGNDTAVSKLIHVFPYPVISTSGNKTICRGNNATISAGGGTSYVWNNGSTTTSISVNPTKTTTYTVVVSNGNCARDTTITVVVDTPAVVGISPNQKICQGGDSVTLTATGGPSYKWSNGATTSSITVLPSSTTTYTCSITKNGCISSDSVKITVDIPALSVCCDKTIMPGGADTIGAAGASTYAWAPNTNIICVNPSCDSIIATPTVTTTYIVTAKDAAGCPISMQVTVFVETPCADFTVPNVFTPNNDGRNDDFVINVLNPSTYSIVIYDRWGKEVYTSTDPTVYWNGKLLNTQYLVTEGVYYYIIKATCGNNDYVKKGFVQVVGEQ